VRRLLFHVIRAVGGRLPPTLLLALLVPPSLVRAAIDVWVHGVRPAPSLPPDGNARTSAADALVERLDFRLTPVVGFWADRVLGRGWRSRFDISAFEQVHAQLAGRPLLLVSLHYGPLVMIPSLLCRHDVPTALAVGPDNWPISPLRQLRLDLVKIGDIPTAVAAEARPMLRFLKPGRCLVVAIDYPAGETVELPFAGSTVRVSVAPLRLARISNALVVPMLARNEGRWRISMRLGAPVPDELLQAGDYRAAAAHVCAELLPLAASAPGQALPTLVEAFSPAQLDAAGSRAAPSRADSRA
jgi:lauroyl/myristoyl acyltransferase